MKNLQGLFWLSHTRILMIGAFMLTSPRYQPIPIHQHNCITTAVSTTTTTKTALRGTLSSSSTTADTTKTVAVLLCPAQFCVPPDYDDLWQHLPDEILVTNNNSENEEQKIRIDREASRVVPLSRRDWIKVAKHLPTLDFWKASLQVHTTLDWYFEAIERGLSEILYHNNNDPNSHSIDSVCLVGHSIGGWVARAYLGGLSRSSSALFQDAVVVNGGKISSLITLGTPHTCPSTALVDQTRGLLQEIANTPECSSSFLQKNNNLTITCVCSSSLAGNFLSTNLEEVIAASSYWSLLGKGIAGSDSSGGMVLGDGIVPLDIAFMESPARRLELSSCPQTARPIRHSHVIPTPWKLWDKNDAIMTPSIRLLDDDNNTNSIIPNNAVSYVSPDIVPLWSQYIR
jgi:PGAP1-like protein